MTLAVPEHILVKYGFKLYRTARTPLSERRYWCMRITGRTMLIYDCNDGFMTLQRDTGKGLAGRSKGSDEIAKIILPKPVRTEEELQELLSVLLPCYPSRINHRNSEEPK